jgi:hypothetical protein
LQGRFGDFFAKKVRCRFDRRRPSMGVEGKKKSKKKVGGAVSVGIKNIAPA